MLVYQIYLIDDKSPPDSVSKVIKLMVNLLYLLQKLSKDITKQLQPMIKLVDYCDNRSLQYIHEDVITQQFQNYTSVNII